MNAPSLAAVLQRLYALAPKGAMLGLDRVRAAAEALGDVHRVGKYVHVAGTNGKGSVAALVAESARISGRRVGLYTSPHLCRFAERIRIDGMVIDDNLLADCLTKALDVSDDLTFFEVTTLAALMAFQRSKLDLLVLEVGLGGRLDATNIVEGDGVQCISRIAFDHVDVLGDNLWTIAQEKAGIMRRAQTCIVGRLHPDALAGVRDMAGEVAANLIEITSEDERALDQVPLSLLGGFQRGNAAVAVRAARERGIPEDAISKALISTSWPGRCEFLKQPDGPYLLDGAHNPDGAVALRNVLFSLSAAFPRKRIALVFGAMADKRWKAMVDRLSSVTGPRVYVEPKGRRAVTPSELSAFMPGEMAASVPHALQLARRAVGQGGLVVVAGSLFLVGEARSTLLNLPMDPQVAL